MKNAWKYLVCIGLGLLLGLCWRPYSVQLINDTTAMQYNMVNGRTWVFSTYISGPKWVAITRED